MRSSLRVAGFSPLAASYTLNGLGDMLGVVALAVLVLQQTGSALATTALFLAAKSMPALLSPALTAGLDQRAIGRVVPVVYFLEAGAFAGLAQLSTAFWLPGVLALAFADGVLALTARGLTRGAVAGVLGPAGVLREGNALLNVAYAITSAAGPVLAGVVIHFGGVDAALWIDAGSFLCAGLLLAAARRSLPMAVVGDHQGWRARVRDGLSHVRSHPTAGRLVAGEGVAIVFFTLVVPISVVFVRETLHSSSLGYGVMLGAWGVGVILGSVVFARAGDMSLHVLVLASTLAVGVGYAGIAASPTLLLACLASVVGGVGNGIQWISVMTALQDSVGDAYQARAAGLLESVGAVAPGIGFVVGGLLTAASSPRVAYAVAGVGAVVIAAVWARRPIVADGAVA
ncbi:MFS transporter [Baekduia soli]|uniref:MFS transporter n=1 Tax=Baekduia soli TaxID=496014 RepID=UPI001652A084|nr:MFS transporter [Baekduia soli]